MAKVADTVAALAHLDAASLRQRYVEAYGQPPPKYLQRQLLALAVAWQLQAAAYGGLTPPLRRELRRRALAYRQGEVRAEPLSRPRPGTQLVREWQGQSHRVTVTADGFCWQGQRFTSLSAVARAITGTRWSGPAFFGLKASRTP